jgi:hypothetical protein
MDLNPNSSSGSMYFNQPLDFDARNVSLRAWSVCFVFLLVLRVLAFGYDSYDSYEPLNTHATPILPNCIHARATVLVMRA